MTYFAKYNVGDLYSIQTGSCPRDDLEQQYGWGAEQVGSVVVVPTDKFYEPGELYIDDKTFALRSVADGHIVEVPPLTKKVMQIMVAAVSLRGETEDRIRNIGAHIRSAQSIAEVEMIIAQFGIELSGAEKARAESMLISIGRL